MPRLELRAVDLHVTRVSRFLSASLSAQLPPELGGRLSFSGTVRGAGEAPTLEWNALAASNGMSFPGWRELLPEYLTRLDAGNGGFKVLLRGRGSTLAGADLDFDAQGVVAKLTEGANARMEQVSAALTLTHASDRWTLLGRRVRVVREGRRDPNSEFDVSWRDNDDGMLELRAKANYLRAEALLPLVGLMPQKELRERLRELAPTGEWKDMRLALERRSIGDPWQFDARAKFSDVGFAPMGHAPGLRGLSGALSGNEAGGHLVLDAQAAKFNWPEQFPQPVDLHVLKATLYWKRDAQGLLIATSDLELRNKDARRAGKIGLGATGRRQLARLYHGEHDRERQRGRRAILFSARAAGTVGAAMARSRLRRRAVCRAADADLPGTGAAFSVSRRQRPVSGPLPHRPC